MHLLTIAVAAAVLALASCRTPTPPAPLTLWVADLTGTDEVLAIEIRADEGEVTGEASLSHLTHPGADHFTLEGTRVADTLDFGFINGDGAIEFRFHGWYASTEVLTGVLNGGRFADTPALFKRP